MSDQNQKQNDQKEKKQKRPDPITIPVNEKIEKRFQTAFGNLVAIAGGREKLGKTKVENANVAKLVDEVFEKRSEAANEEFKTDFNNLIEDLHKFLAASEKAYNEFIGAVSKEKEAFAERAEKLATKVKDVNGIRTNFLKQFSKIVAGGETSTSTDTSNEESDENSNSSTESQES